MSPREHSPLTTKVLITGTSRGIGKHLAEHFLGLGRSVIGCSRKESTIDHPHYQHFICDVSNEAQAQEIFQSLQQAGNTVDILINNAGQASMNHALLTPVSKLKQLLDVNLVGTFLFCREVAKMMIRQRFGRIVNFTTVAVPLNLSGEAAYVAAKAGVASFTKVLARELGNTGITVNAIGPTPIATDLIRSVPKDKIDSLIQNQAIHRLGDMIDVTNVVDFLVSPASSFITGQIVYLGGVSD